MHLLIRKEKDCNGPEKKDLFFSRPMRKAASPKEAKRLPVPALLSVTAYSLTKA
jgi:hypothetical protein